MQRVFSVGIEIPGDVAEFVPFRSDRALFDADVTIFQPTFDEYISNESHAGRPLISESDSPDLVEDCKHWKTELKTASESGKIVFVFLCIPTEVYYDTGNRTYSGTGRNRQATRLVTPKSSYETFPVALDGLMPRGGSEIVALSTLGPLATYWSQFGPQSAYEVYFNAAKLSPILATKNREKILGAIVRSAGALVLLPPLNWEEARLTYTRGEKTYWNADGKKFGKRLILSLVEAAEALRKEGKRSPMPDWATGPEYATEPESRLHTQIACIDERIRHLSEKRRAAETELEEAGVLRSLLFETGKPLERAILKALKLLGFNAEPYNDAESEFDALFVSPEGRCLGEAEGKDNKSVNVDKISQLARNLEEDFAREGVDEYAKGVLFGNAHRLQAISDRGEFFTEKCKKTAARMKVALVKTPDLFVVARYLVAHPDVDYAAACRQAIFNTDGDIVSFPPTPS